MDSDETREDAGGRERMEDTSPISATELEARVAEDTRTGNSSAASGSQRTRITKMPQNRGANPRAQVRRKRDLN